MLDNPLLDGRLDRGSLWGDRAFSLIEVCRSWYPNWDIYSLEDRRDVLKEVLPMVKKRLILPGTYSPLGKTFVYSVPLLARFARVDNEADVFTEVELKDRKYYVPLWFKYKMYHYTQRFDSRNPILELGKKGSEEYMFMEDVGVYLV